MPTRQKRFGDKNPNWKGGKVQKECLICHTHFFVRPSYTTARYCSMRCVGLSQRGKTHTKAHVEKARAAFIRIHHIVVTKQCRVCSTTYEIPRHEYNAGKKAFCSQACHQYWRKTIGYKTKGEQHWNWLGGIAVYGYVWNWRSIRQVIRERDNQQCQSPLCWQRDPSLSVHHINYDKKDNRDVNLICLCRSCNARANINREWWQQLYTSIMEYGCE